MAGGNYSIIPTYLTTSQSGQAVNVVMNNFKMFESTFKITSSFVEQRIKDNSENQFINQEYLNFINEKVYPHKNDKLLGSELNQIESQLKNVEFVQDYFERINKVISFSSKKLDRISNNLSKERIDIDTSLDRLNVSHTDISRKINNLYKRKLHDEKGFQFESKTTGKSVQVSIPVKEREKVRNFIY